MSLHWILVHTLKLIIPCNSCTCTCLCLHTEFHKKVSNCFFAADNGNAERGNEELTWARVSIIYVCMRTMNL